MCIKCGEMYSTHRSTLVFRPSDYNVLHTSEVNALQPSEHICIHPIEKYLDSIPVAFPPFPKRPGSPGMTLISSVSDSLRRPPPPPPQSPSTSGRGRLLAPPPVGVGWPALPPPPRRALLMIGASSSLSYSPAIPALRGLAPPSGRPAAGGPTGDRERCCSSSETPEPRFRWRMASGPPPGTGQTAAPSPAHRPAIAFRAAG
jgi:hypothetical protein